MSGAAVIVRKTGFALFLVILATVLVVVLAMEALSMEPQVALVAAVVALLVAGIWTFNSLSGDTAAVRPPPRAIAPEPHLGADRSVRTIRSSIVFGRWLGANQLHARLVAVIDDRLAERHGIDRQAQPDLAAAVIGPELQRFIDDAGDTDALPPTRRLERIVTLIERL